ncbi:hypothetical protein B0H63DRAFT_529261 [Podospora didyma]|uniref:Uncharacterized protein n=1 Tax=Podospora didyma TaxID=330526 RepID=A0AAE0N1R3_9PEZI|nr:hypothetical protein B0H63DRAFT_529261 [Podospora didyma]
MDPTTFERNGGATKDLSVLIGRFIVENNLFVHAVAVLKGTLDPREQRPLDDYVIEALERLEKRPDQLAHELERRYNDSPPPCSESSISCVTTELESCFGRSPSPPPPSEHQQWLLRKEAHTKAREIARSSGRPFPQFRNQAKRERERLEHQQSAAWPEGRKLMLPHDPTCDLKANAENNVRTRWVEQGIWGEDWGPAWPKGSTPEDPQFEKPEVAPFYNRPFPIFAEGWSKEHWSHEKCGPPPESVRRRVLTIWSWTPIVRDPEASRPYRQFQYQLEKEREWIKGKVEHEAPGGIVDLDALAYKSVKQNWIDDQIWDPNWTERPGSVWRHEEPDEPDDFDEEEPAVEAPAMSWPAVDVNGPNQPHSKAIDGHAPSGSFPPSAPALSPSQDVQPEAWRVRGSLFGSAAEAAWTTERLFQSAAEDADSQPSAPKARTPSSNAVVASTLVKASTERRPKRRRVNDEPPLDPIVTSALRSRPKRGRVDEPAEGNQLPPKRQRRKAPEDGSDIAIAEVRIVAVASSPRRSARISKQEKQPKPIVVAEPKPPTRRGRSKPLAKPSAATDTKATPAKRGRIDQSDLTAVPKRGRPKRVDHPDVTSKLKRV